MRHYKQLTADDRLRIEYYYLKENLRIIDIAKLLNVHKSTIYREIQRGQVVLMNSRLKRVITYSCYTGQLVRDENMRKRGRKNILEKEIVLKSLIINKIKEGYSPRATLHVIDGICTKKGINLCNYTTIYRYCHNDKFNDLNTTDLPYKCFKKEYIKKNYVRHHLKGSSIEQRPKYINKREEFGHWEMDTVMGKQGISLKSILALTERKTRKDLLYKLDEHNSESVVSILDSIEETIGSDCFKKLFKTISVDNGAENQDCEGIERSINGGKRTKVYYCHPRSPQERGSNENQNRMIRRKIPKGTNFDNMSFEELKKVENFINEYPRELFNWKNSNYVFKKEIIKNDFDIFKINKI